jgi:putative phosphoribosyl transferase
LWVRPWILSKVSGFFSALKDGYAFRIKFKDRTSAASILASILKGRMSSIGQNKQKDVIVIGIPRGGAVAADIVAKKLSADFDLVISKRLLAPQSARSIGAMMSDGSIYLDKFVLRSLNVPQSHIEMQKLQQKKEIEVMKRLYRSDQRQYNIEDRIVILVDDGADRGSTIIAASKWVRGRNPKYLIVAIPIASPQGVDNIKQEAEADMVEVVMAPSTFGKVDQFYEKFDSIPHEQVIEIMGRRRLLDY